MKSKTCCGCPHIDIQKGPGNTYVMFGCKKTGYVIPHKMETSDDGNHRVTFWRVPLECPRPDAEVHKSKDRVPHKYWAETTMDQLEDAREVSDG